MSELPFSIEAAVNGHSITGSGPDRDWVERVAKETFENTKSYNQGMVQELRSYQVQYVQADKGHKDALASVILHEYADYDDSKLPFNLQQFMQQLQHDRALN